MVDDQLRFPCASVVTVARSLLTPWRPGPATRLPEIVAQVRLIEALAGRPVALMVVGAPTIPAGGSAQMAAPICGAVLEVATVSPWVAGSDGITAGPSVTVKGIWSTGTPGSGDCCGLR